MLSVNPDNPLAEAIGIQAAAGGFQQEIGIFLRELRGSTDETGNFILIHQNQGKRKLQFPTVGAAGLPDGAGLPRSRKRNPSSGVMIRLGIEP